MKRVLFLAVCLLMIVSLTLPVLATEEYWEAEVDAEETEEELYIQWGNGVTFEQPEDGVIAISPWDSENGEVHYEIVTMDPDMYQEVVIQPEQWNIGTLDGEQIAVPGQSLAIGPSRAFSVIPSAILAVIAVLAIILAVALLVIIVVVAIVLIIKSARKKKSMDIEAE